MSKFKHQWQYSDTSALRTLVGWSKGPTVAWRCTGMPSGLFSNMPDSFKGGHSLLSFTPQVLFLFVYYDRFLEDNLFCHVSSFFFSICTVSWRERTGWTLSLNCGYSFTSENWSHFSCCFFPSCSIVKIKNKTHSYKAEFSWWCSHIDGSRMHSFYSGFSFKIKHIHICLKVGKQLTFIVRKIIQYGPQSGKQEGCEGPKGP